MKPRYVMNGYIVDYFPGKGAYPYQITNPLTEKWREYPGNTPPSLEEIGTTLGKLKLLRTESGEMITTMEEGLEKLGLPYTSVYAWSDEIGNGETLYKYKDTKGIPRLAHEEEHYIPPDGIGYVIRIYGMEDEDRQDKTGDHRIVSTSEISPFGGFVCGDNTFTSSPIQEGMRMPKEKAGGDSMNLMVTVGEKALHITDATIHPDKTISGYIDRPGYGLLRKRQPIFIRQYNYYIVE